MNVAVTSQASGVDVLGARQRQECEGVIIVRGIQALGVESKLSHHILGGNGGQPNVR